MTLNIYNTLTRTKEEFIPIEEGKVGMYVCGPTVYDFAHIGNARPVVVFDILFRVLKRLYKDVTYVRNITDVDDKINAKAQETGEDIRAITEKTARAYHEDMAALNALAPTIEPRATEHIPEMIAMIENLIEAGVAYEAEGHVMFSVPDWDDYGGLSRRNRDEQLAGARVEVAPYKKDGADFVLWKPSDDDTPGWPSPWGRGRPGWHLECSAMSGKYLGKTFDIHGGGQDLIFPHHENEIAQSTCAHGGQKFVNYWMHNGYLMVEGEKMSKSLGNFYTVHDLRDDFPGEAIRLTLMQTHYRSPLDFTKDNIAAAKKKLDSWYRLLEGVDHIPSDLPETVFAALEDDLNTPLALTEMDALATRVRAGDKDAAKALKAAGELMGILQQDVEAWFKGDAADSGDLDIDALIEERIQAKKDKDFARADEIRDSLKEQGILLEDGPDGTTWKRA